MTFPRLNMAKAHLAWLNYHERGGCTPSSKKEEFPRAIKLIGRIQGSSVNRRGSYVCARTWGGRNTNARRGGHASTNGSKTFFNRLAASYLDVHIRSGKGGRRLLGRLNRRGKKLEKLERRCQIKWWSQRHISTSRLIKKSTFPS